LIQERDRIGRLTPASRWIWKKELRSTVDDVAIGPRGHAAVSTNDGEMLIFDPNGDAHVGFRFDSGDPPLLIEAPDNSPAELAWISLSRRAQSLRGHALNGEVLWDRPIPWEGWTLSRFERLALVTAADGRALTCDGLGSFLAQGGPSEGINDVFGIGPGGELIRISRRGVHIICAGLDGRVAWRSVTDQPLGPTAVGIPGTAILVGKSLAWYPNDSTGVIPSS
jgi:hypothetical protein